MKNTKYILIFIFLLIISLFIYLYVKVESFATLQSISSSSLISNQIITEISRVIYISPRRISNLSFTGDISTGKLNVSFNILEPNLTELSNNEMKADDALKYSNDLFNTNKFIIIINNQSVLLNQIQNNTTPMATTNYFNNTGLITISNYANNKYISVPNDHSLTNFYKLDIDNNYNISPNIKNNITIPIINSK